MTKSLLEAMCLYQEPNKQILKKCPGVEEETVDPSQFTKEL